jgi:hypothetical protein
MSILDQLGGLLGQYAGDDGTPRSSAPDDFDQVAQHAPPTMLAQGLAGAFRSQQTPPFAQMLGQVFNHAGGDQKAGIINALIAAVGPALLQQFLGGGGLGNLSGLLGGGHITPEQAQMIPPQAIEAMAQQAEQSDPSVIDAISGFLGGQPGTVRDAFGPDVLSSVLSHLGR